MVREAVPWLGVGMISGALILGIARHENLLRPNVVAANPAPRPERAAARPALRSPSLAREVVVLAQVRRELIDGNSARTLDMLDAYAREFPRGELAAQALLFRVEALRARGANLRAMAILHQFVTNNPKNRWSAPMRKLIREARPR